MPLRSKRFSNNPRLEAAANNQPPLRQGSSGDAVAVLQQALVDLDYAMPISTAHGKTDGIYGNETRSVVARFQIDEGLSSDGVAGRDTIGRLDDIFFDIENENNFINEPPDMRNWSVRTARQSRH